MGQEKTPEAIREVRPPLGATFVMALLRAGVGWHFLYEGTVKVIDMCNGGWSAGGFLRNSTGPLAAWYAKLADNPTWLKCADYANIGGLLIIGAALMFGLLTRTAAFFGIVLLGLYYLAYPPFPGMAEGGGEGHFLVINMHLVEMLALLAILAMPAARYGLDGWLAGRRARREADVDALADQRPNKIVMNLAPADFSRRHVLANLAGLPLVGGYVLALLKEHGWLSHEERVLKARPLVDARSGATIKKFDFSATLKDLKGRPEIAHLGKVPLSRLVLGGNLMGGWAHARDLVYVDKLVKAYHHKQKIYETFRLAEACGINAIITNPILCGVISSYWHDTGGKIQFISDCGGRSVLEGAKKSIDSGASACYFHGGVADDCVAASKFDEIAKVLEFIRKNGLPAGIAGHKLKTVMGCVEKGIIPDFWMKTLHQHNYWSAKATPEHENIFCDDPEGTVAFMHDQKQPWIAYKILAAGALTATDEAGAFTPEPNFRYAFASGADFICVGMYDFQIIEDVNHAVKVLADKDKLGRQRPWCST